MKHCNIRFNLNDYNNGGYTVETIGYNKPEPARIICTDRSSDDDPENKIVALIGKHQRVCIYDTCGRSNGFEKDALRLVKTEFEDGDIVQFHNSSTIMIGIFKKYGAKDKQIFHAAVALDENIVYYNLCGFYYAMELATESQKKFLFDCCKKEQKQWSADKHKMETIKDKEFKFSLNPGNMCMMRNSCKEKWTLCQFSHYDIYIHKFCAAGGNLFNMCKVYDENTKHLLGTNNC